MSGEETRMNSTISWDDFAQIELRVGRIMRAEPFKEARKPAYILHVDFGDEIGMKKSSAQLTELYQPEDLVGRLVVGVRELSPKADRSDSLGVLDHGLSRRTRARRPMCSRPRSSPRRQALLSEPGKALGKKTKKSENGCLAGPRPGVPTFSNEDESDETK